eukprot:403366774
MTEDEAAKCLLVAQEAIKNNDFQKALRFLDKSLRIKETQKAIYLRGQVQKKINGEDVKFEDAKSNHSSSATAASSANSSKQSSHKEEEKTEETPNYTQEDVKRCKEIIAKKCYYEILSVEKSADENHIKKAYRKLALKFHPDKNRAPQATDAFKKVSQAFACLSDPEKRRMYDQHGTEENFQQQYRQQYQEEFDPDDIFRMFFGGNIYTSSFGHGRRHHVNRRQHQFRDEDETGQNQPRQQQSPGLQLIFQMAPLIFFFLLTFVSNIDNFSSGTQYPYSLRQTEKFPVMVQSYRLGETYWIEKSTSKLFGDDQDIKYRLDERFESDLIHTHDMKCDEAKRAKAHYNNLARRYRSTHDYYEVYINVSFLYFI